MHEHTCVDSLHVLCAGSGLTFRTESLEIVVDLHQLRTVKPRIEAFGLENRRHGLRRRLGRE